MLTHLDDGNGLVVALGRGPRHDAPVRGAFDHLFEVAGGDATDVFVEAAAPVVDGQ